MGTLSKHKTTCLTERDIQNILSIHFLTPNAKKYEMENLAKAMSRRAEEASKRIVHLERLLRKNNIEFDRYDTEK